MSTREIVSIQSVSVFWYAVLFVCFVHRRYCVDLVVPVHEIWLHHIYGSFLSTFCRQFLKRSAHLHNCHHTNPALTTHWQKQNLHLEANKNLPQQRQHANNIQSKNNGWFQRSCYPYIFFPVNCTQLFKHFGNYPTRKM